MAGRARAWSAPAVQKGQVQIDELNAETGVADSPSWIPIRRIIRIYSRPSIFTSARSGTSLTSMTLDRTTSSACATGMDRLLWPARRRRRRHGLLFDNAAYYTLRPTKAHSTPARAVARAHSTVGP